LGEAFRIIGENIHTTRVLLLNGRHVRSAPDGSLSIAFTDARGVARELPVPEAYKETQAFAEGRLKHVSIAVEEAMGDGAGAEAGRAYLEALATRQVVAGAAYLDLNVDELTPRLAVQRAAMAWLVRFVQSIARVPVSIDSSHPDILAEGMAAAALGSRPMLNSASLERPAALDVARAHGSPVVVTAAGASGMPQDTDGRVANASRMVDAALATGFEPGDVFVDPLIFPVSVDGMFGRHALDAIAELRRRYGRAIHITGGMSNVSFGMPGRKLLNDVFLRLAIDAGADSGIVDPTTTDPAAVMAIDLDDRPRALARDALLGYDVACRAFLRAYRAREFAALGIAPTARGAA
jgi:5-methyltetrahydrofolate--homocysteine methyltransferase